MHRRAFIAALAPVLAAAGLARADAKSGGQYVDLAPVALPIVAGGRLVNYVFVYIRIDLAPGADTPHWQDKEPYFRDALVRLAHRHPYTAPGDYTRIDEQRMKAELFQAAVAIAGPGTVTGIDILPGGGPMRRVGLPKPPTPSH